MKSSTVVLGLTALALALPGHAEAKRLRQAATPVKAEASAWSADEFAKLDLDALPPPGASADAQAFTRSVASAGGGMSTQLSAPRADRMAVIEPAAEEPRRSLRFSEQAEPRAAARETGPRFDLVVNNAPAAQVFLQMGAGAGVNVLVPPEIKGNISITLRSVNLAEAMEAMRELYGYDFKQSGNRLYVYPNTIQTRIYQVSYLAASREGASVLRVSSPGQTTMSAGSRGGAGGGAGGGTVMGGGSGDANANSSGANGANGGNGGGTASSTTATITMPSTDATRVQMTVGTDFWRDLQLGLRDLLASGGSDRSVVVNPGAGMLVVRASPSEHRQVAEYLKALRVAVQRQVMLEAKIVEVTLSNESQSGVNWSLFRTYSDGGKKIGMINAGSGVTLNQGSGTLSQTISVGNNTSTMTVTPGSQIVNELGSKGLYGLALQAGNFAALLNFLQSQGDVQVLSSPRIATLNNQKAVLKVGTDAYYPTSLGSSSTTSSTTAGTVASLTAPQVNPMFHGIVLDVTPRIDEDGVILLHVHPIISDISVEPFNFNVGELKGGGPLPKVTVSETDSIVRVLDRQIVAIGGLMREQQSKAKSGLPWLSDLPLVGGLFRQKSNATVKQELVVLIKPTVIGNDGEGFERGDTRKLAVEE
ncbi:MAG: hypothetical protein RI907_3719 [Pseudomonadota bacterium]|jgi:MSHA biogenesis protein MshL